MMRLDIHLPKVVSKETWIGIRIALGTLPRVRSIHLVKSGWVVRVYAEQQDIASVRVALDEAAVVYERIESSLDEEADARYAPQADAGERVKAIGR